MSFITKEFDCTLPSGTVLRIRQANQYGAASEAARRLHGSDWYKAYPLATEPVGMSKTTLESDGDFQVEKERPRLRTREDVKGEIIHCVEVPGTERDEAPMRQQQARARYSSRGYLKA